VYFFWNAAGPGELDWSNQPNLFRRHPNRGSRVGSWQGFAWNLSVSDILECQELIAAVKRFWTWMGRPWSSIAVDRMLTLREE
jgi:hypothetical protein